MNPRELIEAELRVLHSQLSADSSPIGDWKNLKQLDTNAYSEEEMAEYRAQRAVVRARIEELEAQLEDMVDNTMEM